MTATSAFDKIESLIEVAGQRLIPQALQRLTVKEILGEHVIRKATLLGIPSKEELGIAAQSDVAYNRLLKFLRLHEPTGHERDVAHKYDVVRFLSLKQLLHECQLAKLPQIQAACLDRVIEWFDASCPTLGSKSAILGSASTPVLPPRMSPRKTAASSASTDITMAKSSSQEALATGHLDGMRKATVAQKLEMYKMPDIRASHIRRVAQLRSRGARELPEEDLEIPEDEDAHPEDGDVYGDPILEPLEYEQRDRRARIKATFKSYEPQTEAEFAMNQVWLDRKREEDLDNAKAHEVRGKLQSWSMSKSRDESEYLRKREAMQLAAGLDKLVDGELDRLDQPRRRHLDQKKQEWQALQHTAPPSVADRVDYVLHEKSSTTDPEDGTSTPARISGSALQRDSVKKKKSSAGGAGGAGTPIGSGGMHFRNQLPANYTPQSKKSSGTPTSFPSTPSTPLSTSSSGKLQLLDEAAARAERRAASRTGYSASPVSNEASPAVHNDSDDRVESSFVSPSLQFSDRVQETCTPLKFQPFHTTWLSNQGSIPLSRAVSASALNRKLYPRGTIPPQPEPTDLEYRHLYAAATNRKPPLPPNILPDKPLVAGQHRNSSTAKVAVATTNQRQSIRPSSTPTATKLLPRTATTGVPPPALPSDFRTEQMHEIDRIRVLFEQYTLPFPIAVVERGLLVPEDRSTLECALNLPLPGSQLISNPLLQVRIKTKSTKKKKKKKKKNGKAGARKTKGKNTAGDRSRSPTKKKKS